MLLESVEHDPLIWTTIEENEMTMTNKYDELSAIDKIQADCDLKATNIIFQGLPFYIYSLVNHHKVAKDLCERFQLLMQGTGGNNSGLKRVMKCFNYQGEGHMARQCPNPKRRRDATWFRDKVLLVKAQGKCKVLNEEELEFLADPGITKGPVTQTVITHNAAYQADDLDAYDFDCDDFSTTKAVLMANLSSYGLDILSKETNVISIADSEETLMLEEESRSKMLLKQSDPMVIEKKVNTKQINYVKLNQLSKDFGKHFVPQRELSDKQALHPNTDQSASSLVKIEGPRKLPKNNLKAELQAKDITIKKLKANIKRLNKTSTTNSVKRDIDEIETINIKMEHKVTKLIVENEHLKRTYKKLYDSIKPSRVQAKEHVESLVNDS
nr:hypothetical protein [Tanacetum cinerariifolium]